MTPRQSSGTGARQRISIGLRFGVWHRFRALFATLAVGSILLAGPPRVLASSVNVLTLIDGKEIVGEALNEEFHVQTPYALLVLPRATVSSLLLDPSGHGIEGAALVNEDRVSGFVVTRTIDFRERSGAILHLRKEKVRNLALSLPSRKPAPGTQTFRFRNGDFLSGRILDKQLSLQTAYGSVEVPIEELAQVDVFGSIETRVRVTLLQGKRIDGRLQEEDLQLQLESGRPVKIFLGSLERITQTALPEPPATLAARLTSTKGMLLVEGGEFTMGAMDGEADERPQKRTFVAPFYIDRTEVTNEEYGRFVLATGHRPPRSWKEGRMPGGGADLPVVYVSFQDASDYARWAGKRLPTEEEWEKAARGTDGRRYPWGKAFDVSRANSRETGLDGPIAVGSLPTGASPCGAVDMAGNVWEWTDSWYQPRKSKVFKGGSFRDSGDKLRCSYRSSFNPNLEADDLGFRCARSARSK